MSSVLSRIKRGVTANEKMLGVLIDPEKFQQEKLKEFLEKIPGGTSFILVGGSTVPPGTTDCCVKSIKNLSNLPVILFPGHHSQVCDSADAILFLSLLSGRNPEFLIGQQIKAAQKVKEYNLEALPTGYILIDGGHQSAVARVTGTEPMSQSDPDSIAATALAAKFSGKKLVYLEAGSGAKQKVKGAIISQVKAAVELPLIVGGGIKSPEDLDEIFQSGADMAVIGTSFENGDFFL